MKIEELYQLYKVNGLVDTDTRSIRTNTIFFALKGDNFNGNKFAAEALKNGAKFAVIDEVEYKTNDACILVDDVLKTLQELASYHRLQLGIPIVALTGSNGKTTTKELINAILSFKYKVTATKGNLNNHIGVPLTLLSMNSNTEIGIVEMGANHHNEIAFLSNLVNPDYGYITNFGSAHLEGFGSLEGVVKAKSELYDYLIANNKTIFVNPNDEKQVAKTKDANVILFDDSIDFIAANPFVTLSLDSIDICSNLIGIYNFSNICSAITIAKHFKVSNDQIKNTIEAYTPSNNRSQIINTDTNKIILDAYNANPTSMKVALESFNKMSSENKCVILGDMFELGKYALEEHQNIVDFVNDCDFNTAYFIGENFANTNASNFVFKDFEELKAYLHNNPIINNTILIKGSRGMALERVVKLC
ncbi:MAG: UDP-N-acetylmuramoyl-tripeptide--D-alanyl-D-alanine ligase [Tenacibaculum sp.]